MVCSGGLVVEGLGKGTVFRISYRQFDIKSVIAVGVIIPVIDAIFESNI